MSGNLDLATARGRLARFLLRLGNGGNGSPPIYWTRSQVGDDIGCSPAVVSGALRSLAREGVVRLERGRLVVANLAAIECEAGRASEGS
jgi:CRP-like cAMP-binding protein